MIRTYLADISSLLADEVYERYYSQAPAWRKKKADRMKFGLGKAQSIGAWSLLEYARKQTGAGEAYGYNLSHSGNYVLCALDDKGAQEAVGCDIETVKEVRLKVAEHFFCESEYQRLKALNDDKERQELFYRLWVLKESFMKATRQGMKLALDSFEIGFDESGDAYLRRKPDEYPRSYYYTEYRVKGTGAKIAVCTTGVAASDVEIVEL